MVQEGQSQARLSSNVVGKQVCGVSSGKIRERHKRRSKESEAGARCRSKKAAEGEHVQECQEASMIWPKT